MTGPTAPLPRATFECVLMGGFGGLMPTLSRLAATLPNDPNPALSIGFFLPWVLFFIIGAAVAYAFSEKDRKRAFMLGVAAPAIIASIVSGGGASGSSPPQNNPPAIDRAREGNSGLFPVVSLYTTKQNNLLKNRV